MGPTGGAGAGVGVSPSGWKLFDFLRLAQLELSSVLGVATYYGTLLVLSVLEDFDFCLG